jgi:hypothetical protein
VLRVRGALGLKVDVVRAPVAEPLRVSKRMMASR